LFQLRQAAVRTNLDASAKKAHVVGVARELIMFEREHIQKENELLYPTVKSELSGRTIDELSQGLFRQEDADMTLVESAWLRSLGEALVREYPGRA
jgi:hemerythrin-like domain-containing protein